MKILLRILNYSLVILILIIILHYSWFLKDYINTQTKINTLSDYSKKITREEKKDIFLSEERKSYVNYLSEYQRKGESLINYYLKKKYKCWIKDYSWLWISIQREISYNINYEVFWDTKKNLLDLIQCNIHNSEINSLYLEINYSKLLNINNWILERILSFMKKYKEKWYNINLIININSLEEYKVQKNIFTVFNSNTISNVYFIYKFKFWDKSEEIYKVSKKVYEFYVKYYSKNNILFNFWIDREYTSDRSYEFLKGIWVRTWLKIQKYSELTKEKIPKEIILDSRSYRISHNNLIEVKDDYFWVLKREKKNYTHWLINYLDSYKKISDLLNTNWKFIIDLNISKENLDLIDISKLKTFISLSNMKLILPNSYSLVQDITFESQLDRLRSNYSIKLKKIDLDLIYYKFLWIYYKNFKSNKS